MAEAEDALDAVALPAPNPDALATVNDFLDYTEYFPSDLVRSLTLIGDCDANYRDAAHHVHELTALYGKLPALAEQERPDPVRLRSQIAHQLQQAISQRQFAFAEASRLYDVSVRHCQRSSVIRRKLQAQPQPPSRDPTPPPISPQAARSQNRHNDKTPHLRLTFDAGRHGPPSSARPRDRHRKTAGSLPSRRSRAYSALSDSDSDIGPTPNAAANARRLKLTSEKQPKPARSRAAGGVLGTNVHSTIAGISTSNALAQLHPPPPDAKPGSKWAPWKKLTEYEMAVLRKSMKKNAVWTPSLTMVNRELERKHRTKVDYEKEKARCEATGDEFLDEEPETLQQIMDAQGMGDQIVNVPAAENATRSSEPLDEDARGDDVSVAIRSGTGEAKEGRNVSRTTQRQKALRDTRVLEDATKNLTIAADGLKELTFISPVVASSAQKRKPSIRPSNKRKLDASLSFTTDTTTETANDASEAEPEPKRQRVELNASTPEAATTIPNSIDSTPSAIEQHPEDSNALISGVIDPALENFTPAPEAMDTDNDDDMPPGSDTLIAPPVNSAPPEPGPSLAEEPTSEQISAPVAASPRATTPTTLPELANSTTVVQSPTAPATPGTSQAVHDQSSNLSSLQTSPVMESSKELTNSVAAPTTTSNTVVPIFNASPALLGFSASAVAPVDQASLTDSNTAKNAPLTEPDFAADLTHAIGTAQLSDASPPNDPASPAVSDSSAYSRLNAGAPSTKSASTAAHVESVCPAPIAPLAPPAPPPTISTAASSRPKRETGALKAPSPNLALAQPKKTSGTSSPAPNPALESTQMVMRSHSRSHVPTPKAQSEEPKAHEAGRNTRGSRRYSIFSQSVLTAPGSTRMSRRRKPPPKGEITSAEGGPKTITNTKRQGRTARDRRRRPAEDDEDEDDSIHPDETRYCICNNVSDGDMISCDNNVGPHTLPFFSPCFPCKSVLTSHSVRTSGSTSRV